MCKRRVPPGHDVTVGTVGEVVHQTAELVAADHCGRGAADL